MVLHAVLFLLQVDVKLDGTVTIELHSLGAGRSIIILNCTHTEDGNNETAFYNTTTCPFTSKTVYVCVCVCVCVCV